MNRNNAVRNQHARSAWRRLTTGGCAIAATCTALGLTGNAEASWNFLDNDSSIYFDQVSQLGTGEDEIGIGMWIQMENIAAGANRLLIDTTSVDGLGKTIGYRVLTNGEWLTVEYGGYQTNGKYAWNSHLFFNIFDLDTDDDYLWNDWDHLVVNIEGDPSKIEVWVNGVLESSQNMTGKYAQILSGTDGIRLGGDTGFNSLNGALHDVTILDRSWFSLPGEIPTVLINYSAWDAVDPFDMAFYAPMREAAVNDAIIDSISQTEGDLINGMSRGLGPAILYSDQKPTILTIGDTQRLSEADPEDQDPDDPLYYKEMRRVGEFIRVYQDSLDIQAVFHVGDWVQDDVDVERARALVNQMKDEGIPWTNTLGNHDYDGFGHAVGDRGVLNWDTMMPMSLLESEAWYVTSMEGYMPGVGIETDDEEFAHVIEFEIDGDDQLAIVLPCGPTQRMLDWMMSIVQQNPTTPIWIVNHAVIKRATGSRRGKYLFGWEQAGVDDDGYTDDAHSMAIDYFANIPNLKAVMCGHSAAKSARRTDGKYSGGCYPTIHIDAANDDFGFPDAFVDGDGRGFVAIMTYDSAGASPNDDMMSVETFLCLEDTFYLEDGLEDRYDYELSMGGGCDELWEICESNGIADDLEVYLGIYVDCNGNERPDGCGSEPEIPDCNRNGVPDCDDIDAGTSIDCNFNGVPDECEGTVYCDPGFSKCLISEVLVSPSTGQFIEILAEPNSPLDGHAILVVNSSSQGELGEVLDVISLDGIQTNSDGIGVVSDGGVDALDLPSFDSFTLLLVFNNQATVGLDLDNDDNGVFDHVENQVVPTHWGRWWASIALVDCSDPIVDSFLQTNDLTATWIWTSIVGHDAVVNHGAPPAHAILIYQLLEIPTFGAWESGECLGALPSQGHLNTVPPGYRVPYPEDCNGDGIVDSNDVDLVVSYMNSGFNFELYNIDGLVHNGEMISEQDVEAIENSPHFNSCVPVVNCDSGCGPVHCPE